MLVLAAALDEASVRPQHTRTWPKRCSELVASMLMNQSYSSSADTAVPASLLLLLLAA